jgi:hypothetical protein
MKKVLSLLLIFVFLNVQSWAFAPVYPTASQNVSGTYAGVLEPVNQAVKTSASIGVFAIGIPSSQTSSAVCTGAAVLFAAGAGYPSFLNGVFDPESSTLTAIIEGQASVSSQVNVDAGVNPITGQPETTTTTTETQIFAQGSMTAQLQQAPQIKGSVVAAGPGTAGAERLNGTASVDLFSSTQGNGSPNITSTVKFTVTGFQQSSVFSTPTIVIVVPGSQTSNTNGS